MYIADLIETKAAHTFKVQVVSITFFTSGQARKDVQQEVHK